jgi:hypothetical protein
MMARMEPGGVEVLGEAVSGGLAARAVEPAAGEGRLDREGQFGGEGAGACLNCATELVGPYCHRCGQSAHVHRTVTAWWHDLAHGVFHLDGKIWRTLPLLAWRPGELTRRYVRGERARFVSPLALFLFSVFLMFAVLNNFAGVGQFDDSGLKKGLSEEVAAARAQVARIEQERGRALAAHRPTAEFDARLKEARDEASLLATMKDRGMLKGTTVRVSNDLPEFLRQPILHAAENPSLLVYKLQSNAYKFSWALIPISVPFLWLLLLHRGRYRREYKAYDHLVFVTYSIAFMSLTLIAFVLLRAIGLRGGILALPFLLVPPVHMYRQLRGAYDLGRFSAAWRAAALLLFADLALMLFMLLLLALGVAH